MVTMLTAHDVFNGPGLDDAEMLHKAERELLRMRASRFADTHDHMFNCAVTLAAVADWTFHLKLSHLPRWSGKREQHFTNWLRRNCDDAFVFIDLSNEFKHANRNKPSTLAEKMMVDLIDLNAQPHKRSEIDPNKGWVEKFGIHELFLFPAIRFNGKTEPFYDPAERAIAWWRSFDPANAEPLSA
ncbi:hypothetical protein [Caballeronia sp. LZ019]|uniref:hypothetical protein n=1 Tax=Caballeronia sp. LZ019 TaxID=3038555 RepID=UPI002865D6D1|nr:hypothetical protein [Caballeronia sp. LZ019]MDR5809295.1 hypothetical protein [Caballeronia sp. LZ019]